MAYNVNYPIIYNIGNNGQNYRDYTIVTGGQTVYTGRIYFKSESESSVAIDIAPICKDYIDVLYEDIVYPGTASVQALPADGLIQSVNIFTVTPAGGTGESFTVVYNYNTDYITETSGTDILNEPVVLEADPRQYLFMGSYSSGSVTFSYSTDTGLSGSSSGSSDQIQLYALNLNSLNLDNAKSITLKAGDQEFKYRIMPECKSRFALYYVNKYGGFDAALFSGHAIENWNPQRVDVRLYNDRANRRDWEQKRLLSEIDKGYELNTGIFLDDMPARAIDNLIYSPKVFIHDLESGTITSCLITDSSYETRDYRGDRLFNYTVNVKESQKQIRR